MITEGISSNNIARIDWVDYGKAVCMLCVVLFHTWTYYADNGIVILRWIEPFYLSSFFFISGYLTKIKGFDLYKSFISILKRLVWPYILFSSIIWLPKAFSHGTDLNIVGMIIDIGGGYASWFVAALICAKIIQIVFLYYNPPLSIMWLIGLACFLCGLILSNITDYQLPWFLNNGLIAVLYLVLGITYKIYENRLSKPTIWKLAGVLLVYLFAVIINNNVHFYDCICQMYVSSVDLSKACIYFLFSSFAIYVVVTLLKSLPSGIRWLSFIGKYSLIFYFLNGGVITVINALFVRFGLGFEVLGYFGSFIVFLISSCILFVSSLLISKYAPWMIGAFK